MAEKASPSFYLLHGDDDISIDEALSKLRAGMGSGSEADLNTSEFDGQSASVPEILNAVTSYPFLADKRMAIVRGLIGHLTRKGAGETGKQGLQRLLEALPELPSYSKLILVERESLRSDLKIVKLAQSAPNGYMKEFSAPKDTTQWIMARARDTYDAQIEPRAAVALASVTGPDLRRADNELIKLVSYVDGERPINEEDVTLLTPYVAEANVFAMIDALAVGDGRSALTLMHRVLEADPSDPGFGLFALITRQFRLLLLTREHLAGGGSAQPNEVANAIGVRSSWQAGKLAQQSRAFSVDQLETIYKRLQRYDQDMKIGQIKPRLALDLLVASLSR